ncbi:hypothetical protein SAMN05192545_2890 [Maribacter dokdonensis]|uniref:Uncharacterized protein n=1 Tax=Maribacter dokdonensis TaxID=320912 RepID=A0ABY0UTK7_9FLAO|nr:hypothetical protein [Maribacter dokdonensis]SDT15411.1 hypothetical protein SAMN05192545_2890 [Maribacter dokdonensis]
MAQTKEALLADAERLNINVDGLDYNQLRTAVKTAKEAADGDEGENGESTETPTETTPENATVARQVAAREKRAKATKQAAKEAKKKKAKAAETKAASESKKEGKDNRPVFTDDRELKFRFKKTAPESLNIDGKSHKTADIIKNEEIMLELVYGNSNYIEQIH